MVTYGILYGISHYPSQFSCITSLNPHIPKELNLYYLHFTDVAIEAQII